MSRTKAETPAPEEKAKPTVEIITSLELPLSVREEIAKKPDELKQQYKLRKVFVAIVEGEEGVDEKPFYITYLRRPGLMHFSQYMNFVQKDVVQANKMLATNIYLAGDKELIEDEDLFIYGLLGQLNYIIEARNGDLVKR